MATASTTIEPTSFAAEVAQRLGALGASQNFLAEYAGISRGETSKILTGVRPQDCDRVNQIRKALCELEELAEMFRPLALDFHDVEAVRAVLHSPTLTLPNLFQLILNLEDSQFTMTTAHAERIAEKLREGNRLQTELNARIAESKQRTQELWLEFLSNPSGRQEI